MFDFPVQKRRKSTVKYYVIAYQSKQRANTVEPELTHRLALDYGWRTFSSVGVSSQSLVDHLLLPVEDSAEAGAPTLGCPAAHREAKPWLLRICDAQFDCEILDPHCTPERRHAHAGGVDLAAATIHFHAFDLAPSHLPTKHPGKVMNAVSIIDNGTGS